MIYLGTKAVDILRMAEAADDQDEYVRRQALATRRHLEKPITRKCKELRERGYIQKDDRRFEGYTLTDKGRRALAQHIEDPSTNPLIIRRADLEAMAKEAGLMYPEECCGVLVVQGDLTRVVPCRNVQTELHRLKPKLFEKDGTQAYAIHPDDVKALKAEYLDQGWGLQVIYHSHVETPPTFSRDDAQKAVHNGRPLFPKVDYVVMGISAKDPAPEDVNYTAAYRWNDAAEQFLPVKVDVL